MDGTQFLSGSLNTDSSGLVVGPSAAVEITLDAWTGYIYDAFENDLSILSGDYSANRFFATLNDSQLRPWLVYRPKLGVYYSFIRSMLLSIFFCVRLRVLGETPD